MAEYIDKAVVDKTLCSFIRELNRAGAGIESSAVFEALARVRYIPAADVRENVKGEWVLSDMDKDCVTCSNCKKLKLANRLAFTQLAFDEWGLNFRPNCGAQMEVLDG